MFELPCRKSANDGGTVYEQGEIGGWARGCGGRGIPSEFDPFLDAGCGGRLRAADAQLSRAGERRASAGPDLVHQEPEKSRAVKEDQLMTTLDYIPPYTPATPVRVNYVNTAFTVKSWLLTKDHKRIGILYLISITAFFMIGGAFATAIRLELMTPAGDL